VTIVKVLKHFLLELFSLFFVRPYESLKFIKSLLIRKGDGSFLDKTIDEKKILYYVLAPTAALAACLKFKNPTKINEILTTLNIMYWIIAVLLSGLLFLVNEFLSIPLFIAYLILYYCFSRSLEIFQAFVIDVHSQLSNLESNSTLKYYERISLAAISYLELIFIFGISYFIVSIHSLGLTNACGEPLNMWESIYFSGVTITTLGYGDFSPSGMIPQFVTVYEVLCGFSLIIVSFTVYVSRSIQNNESESPLPTDQKESTGEHND